MNPRRRLAFRQCDVTRALKAAKAAGGGRVIVHLDGKIEIKTDDGEADHRREHTGRGREIVL